MRRRSVTPRSPVEKTRTVFSSVLVAWTLSGFLACSDGRLPCEGPQNCPGDMACVNGYCQERACISSLDCDLAHHCDTYTGQCVPGCLEDSDCRFGESCEAGTCVEKKCTSTTVDCQAGEYCDTSSGTCFPAAGPYCTPCVTDLDCGGGNNQCMYVGGTGPYCLPECDSTRPCPAGYDCVPLSNSGEIVAHYCVALCGYINTADPDTWETKRTGRPGVPSSHPGR